MTDAAGTLPEFGPRDFPRLMPTTPPIKEQLVTGELELSERPNTGLQGTGLQGTGLQGTGLQGTTPHHRSDVTQRELATVARSAFRAVALLWLLAAAVVFIASTALSTDNAWAAVVITIGSGLIAATAMLAPIVLPTVKARRMRAGQTGSIHHFFVAAAAGMTLRLIGTVALFLTCRYHLAASTEMIAAMTIGWYIFLTSVEVTILARDLANISVVTGSAVTGNVAVGTIETRTTAAHT